MGRRWRTRLVLVIVAIGLTLAVVRIVRRDLLRSTKASPSASLAARASRDPETAQPDGDDSSTSELEAERVREPPLPPPREGMVRYHARLVRSDGKPHSYYMSEATPAGSSESQSIAPTKNGNATVDAPAECRSIDFTSHGFVTVHHAITQREFERLDLGSIVFEQAARLEVEILHAPRHKEDWLLFDVMVKVDVSTGWGDSIGFGREKLATPDGGARATFLVPSDREIGLSMTGDGVSLHRMLAPLPAGTTPYKIDFTQLRTLRGHVVGVPTTCAKGKELFLGRITGEGDGLNGFMDVRVALDENGGFCFLAIPDGPFALRLNPTILRESGGSHREWWQAESIPPERDLMVEPVEPLLGLEVGPIDASSREERQCQVDLDGPTPSFFLSQPTGDPGFARGLIRAASLQSATRAFIWFGSNKGNCRQLVIPIEQIPRPRDGLVSIRLDALKRATASLTVSLPIFASRDWQLLLVKAGTELYSPSDRVPVRRERGLFSFTFSDLEAGSYDVIASLHDALFHRIVRGLVLGEGESVTVDAKLPDPSQIEGRVTNWNDIPAALRPEEISFGGWSRIVNGRFSLQAILPIDDRLHFNYVRGQSIDVAADPVTLEDGSLAVTYPLNELELFDLETSVPGSTHVYASLVGPSTPETLDDRAASLCRRAGVDSHGTISIVRHRGESIRGWINAVYPGGDGRILAWFSSDVPTGTIVPDGRFVDVEFGADGTIASVVLVPGRIGDWQPPRIPAFKAVAGVTRRFWLPAGVEFLDVEFAGRPRDRVPAASIGDRWTIAPR